MLLHLWTVKLTRDAYKRLKKLPIPIQDLVDEAITALEHDGPIPDHWDVKKTGHAEYRIRLNYRYRMRYTLTNNDLYIEVFYLGHRKNAYRTF
jgi:mRNA interferase RelE/StbE